MTANKVEDIRSHRFSDSDRLFLDANIWLSVYGPLTYKHRASTVYSQAIRDIQNAGCTVLVNVLVLSEFINVVARWEWKQSFRSYRKFKDFRLSPDFNGVAKDIELNAKRIVRQCRRCDCDFPAMNLEDMLSQFGKGDYDFNDQIFCEICRRKGLTLITDDLDFKGTGVTILTANSRLLGL